MPFAPGVRVGVYDVLGLIGVGGMGEVYRARDSKLNREVALKTIPDSFALDRDRLARFTREAQVLASLNHPNIAAIYGLEESQGIRALVLELVEGPTLADRIARGRIPLDDALTIARQISDALEAAHERGIVHRDLKPANIKLRADGTVKVLDFGLAKAISDDAVHGDVSQSPTITSPAMTRMGVILGTAGYMSPEQARGRTVDRRTDIWAFGVVLYEMVTGQRLFRGEDVTETVAAVVKDQPDLGAAPAEVRRLLRACLEKDPKRRLQAIGDVWLLVTDATTPEVRRLESRRSWIAWALAAAGFILAAGVSWMHFRERPPVPELVRFRVPPPKGTAMIGGQPPVLSPDGRRLLFIAGGPDVPRRLWMHSLDSLESQPLPGTDDASGAFWSPDSLAIGFVSSSSDRLMRVDAAGGPVRPVAEPALSVAHPGAWSRDGQIVFATPAGLSRVSQAGGTPTRLTSVDSSRGEVRHQSPALLPDGVHFLYRRESTVPEHGGIYLGSLGAAPEQQPTTRLIDADADAIYVPPSGGAAGYVLFVQQRVLMAQPFDERRLEFTGEPVPIVVSAGEAGAGFFSASTDGVLAYRPNRSAAEAQLQWFSREGTSLSVALTSGITDVALSPNGARVVGRRAERGLGPGVTGRGARGRGTFFPGRGGTGDIWVGELERGTSTRITSNAAEDGMPVWSRDGTRIIFASDRDGSFGLYQRSASGTGADELLFKSDQRTWPSDWPSDGVLLYSSVDPKTGEDVWSLPLKGTTPGQPVPYLKSQFNEGDARLSPDGRWIAYRSDDLGRDEIYVQAFPKPTGAVRISTDGGREPRWRRDGRALFYLGRSSQIMTVEVTTNPAPRVTSVPRRLFVAPIFAGPLTLNAWDVTDDGQKFLILTNPDTTLDSGSVTVVLNWPKLLKK